jgi:endonuclease/exonuclease/phosphatase family metal-dependent hydrolase
MAGLFGPGYNALMTDPFRPAPLEPAQARRRDGPDAPDGHAPDAAAPRARRGPSGPRLRVLTYNAHRCQGADRRLSPARIAEVIARCEPDVVALQELDMGRARSGGVDQAHLLARQLGMDAVFHPVRPVGEGWSGIAVLTRHPVRLVQSGLLPALAVARRLEPRGALWVEVQVGGDALQIVNTHLSLIGRERVRQVAALLGPEWLGRLDCAPPKILLGDFNAVPRSAAYQAITRTLADAQRLLAPARRPIPTFPARLPTLRLDHVFVSPESVRVAGVEVPRSLLTRMASDHLPLVVDVELLAELAVGPSVMESSEEPAPAEPARPAARGATARRGRAG